MMSKIPRRQALAEILFVVLPCAVYVTADISLPKRWTFLGIAVLLLAYAAFVRARGRERARDFGFRIDNLASAGGPIAIGTAVGVTGILAWSLVSGRTPWRSDLAILLPLYPLFGVVQQFVFQGVFHRRLRQFIAKPTWSVLATSLLFALVHLGNPILVALCFIAGLFWSALYLRAPNLWLLGASHGLLAALTYPLILEDRPLERL